MVACRLTLLGGFALVTGDGRQLSLPTRKDRLLLAYLALSAGKPQTRERLAGLLWGDRADAQARDSLKQALAGIRQVFRQTGLDPLRADRESVTFEPAGVEIDAIEFARLVTEASAPERAVALYRGCLLDGIDGATTEFEECLRAERERLSDLAVRALEQTALCATPSGATDDAIRLGRHLLACDPLREPVYRALMRLSVLKGDRAEALKIYAACRDALKQDLGVAPDIKTEELYRDILTDRLSPSSVTSESDRTPERPSIAVLPFTNLSGDPEQAYFGDGVVEDIITELSRFRSLFVIARNSSFAFRDERIDIAEIARRLGVQYVVEGSIRKVGNRVRITAQLIDAARGAHLWAERYDRELEDIFAVQDEVVRTVVATVAGRVEMAGAQVAKRKPPENLVAYDYVLRGLEQLSLVGEEHNSEARRLFEKAVELDPQYAAGHAYLALTIYVQWIANRAPGELDRALTIARRALALDENDNRCHRILSHIYTHMRQFDRAEFHSERSVALNPNDAHAAIARANVLRNLGRLEEGVEWVRKALRLNPYHPNWYWNSFARALHAAGHYAEALDAYSRIAERPSFYDAYVAACHAELGHMEEARTHAESALKVRPDFSIGTWSRGLPYKNDADLQRFLDGLRKAGLPE